MSNLFEDVNGNIMIGEAAGGTGGGTTSSIVRHTTNDEKTRFHETRVHQARMALDAAEMRLKHAEEARDAHAAHMADTAARIEADAALSRANSEPDAV